MGYLKDKTTAFAGLSGVGKSSLLSIITNGELETGSISEKISRGNIRRVTLNCLNLKAEALYLIHRVSVHLKLKI